MSMIFRFPFAFKGAKLSFMKKMLEVPHFDQYIDVVDPQWQERTCAVVSLIMVMEYYGKEVEVEEAIERGQKVKVKDPTGIVDGYDPNFGWRHDAIVGLAKEYGFIAERTENDTVENLIENLSKNRPVLVNIHKNFDPKEGGHFAVLTGFFSDDKAGEIISFYLNDPIGVPYKYKNKGIPFDVFMDGWKKRSIYVKKAT